MKNQGLGVIVLLLSMLLMLPLLMLLSVLLLSVGGIKRLSQHEGKETVVLNDVHRFVIQGAP